MRHGSLFSGIGGFDLAAEWMGWTNIFHCEWAEFQRKILGYYFPSAISYHDIRKTDFRKHRGQIDVLTGGFPCQPFSLAGKRKGADDDRYLWDEMLRAIREIQPTWIVGENVAGLISMAQPGETIGMEIEGSLFGEDNKAVETIRQEYVIETICRDLEREGYSVQPLVIPACAVGAPHRRDRLWIIAHCSDAGTQDLQLGGQDGICESGTSSDSRLLGQKERQELPMGAVKLCEKQSPANTYNIHRDKGGTAGGGVTEDPTRRSRILIDTERLGDLRTTPDTESSGSQREYKCGSWENEPIGRDCQEIQACWENFPTQPPICGRDDGISDRLDGITFPKLRSKSIEGYGNAVVPQVVYQIFKAIERVEYGNGKNKEK